jgi:mannose-6-phosphate isomerase-like protein (cupin superfamily)
MKTRHVFVVCFAVVLTLTFIISSGIAQQGQGNGYVLQHEKEIALKEPGTHNGGGMTTGYNFFSKTPDLKFVFRKRVLHPGSAIGYHKQEVDEVYYILSGAGEMSMNGKTFPVKAGDAILTRPGNSHGLKPTGKSELALIIAYEQK